MTFRNISDPFLSLQRALVIGLLFYFVVYDLLALQSASPSRAGIVSVLHGMFQHVDSPRMFSTRRSGRITTYLFRLKSNCTFIVIHTSIFSFLSIFFFERFYLFLERREGREKERERNINVWLPLMCPQPGTCPATQPCALTGNQTGELLVRRPALNPLSNTSQGGFLSLFDFYFSLSICFTHFLWGCLQELSGELIPPNPCS